MLESMPVPTYARAPKVFTYVETVYFFDTTRMCPGNRFWSVCGNRRAEECPPQRSNFPSKARHYTGASGFL